MILVDSNILMYAAGTPHPNKRSSLEFLRRAAGGELEVTLNAEVLQEILHRYRALNRWKEGMRVYDQARHIVPLTIPITAGILDRSRLLLDEYEDLMSRDAVHAAVVEIHRLEAICSYDRDFDQISWLRRIEPAFQS